MSTLKLFIIIATVFAVLAIFILGSNPFSFGAAYFMPRASQSTPIPNPNPSVIVLPN